MKIYVVAPARVYTGGPTALFQLCHTLRRFGIDSYMAFYNVKPYEDPVHDDYKHFQCPWISINDVNDDVNNAIIVPETATFLLSKFNNVKKIIYWLAVDNYILTNYMHTNKKLQFIRFMLKNYPCDLFSLNFRIIKNHYLRFYLNSFKASYVIELIKRRKVKPPKADLHVVQSNYAKVFLESCGVNKSDIVLINEPIEEEFLDMARKVNLKRKYDIIEKAL